jgi:hypothetical protein
MVAADHGLLVSQADGDVRADHVPGHRRSVPLRLLRHASACPEPGTPGPADRHQAGASAYGPSERTNLGGDKRVFGETASVSAEIEYVLGSVSALEPVASNHHKMPLSVAFRAFSKLFIPGGV